MATCLFFNTDLKMGLKDDREPNMGGAKTKKNEAIMLALDTKLSVFEHMSVNLTIL